MSDRSPWESFRQMLGIFNYWAYSLIPQAAAFWHCYPERELLYDKERLRDCGRSGPRTWAVHDVERCSQIYLNQQLISAGQLAHRCLQDETWDAKVLFILNYNYLYRGWATNLWQKPAARQHSAGLWAQNPIPTLRRCFVLALNKQEMKIIPV